MQYPYAESRSSQPATNCIFLSNDERILVKFHIPGSLRRRVPNINRIDSQSRINR